MRASTPLLMLRDSTILSAFGQSVELSPGWMWNSRDSGIRQPTDDSSSSVESDSTVLMVSLDISWASGSLDLDHASPEPTAGSPPALPPRQPPQPADDGSDVSSSDGFSTVDASEGMDLRPARGPGKLRLVCTPPLINSFRCSPLTYSPGCRSFRPLAANTSSLEKHLPQ